MNRADPTKPPVDVLKILDRISAALAALDDERAPKRKPRGAERPDAPAAPKVRLRHNWG